MKIFCIGAAALMLTIPPAMAMLEPDTDMFDGAWTAVFSDPPGSRREATVNTVKFQGTWREKPAGRNASKDCRGRDFPVTVNVSTEREFTFTVWRQTLDAKCPNLTVTVHPAGIETLTGTIEGLGPVQLRRPGSK